MSSHNISRIYFKQHLFRKSKFESLTTYHIFYKTTKKYVTTNNKTILKSTRKIISIKLNKTFSQKIITETFLLEHYNFYN